MRVFVIEQGEFGDAELGWIDFDGVQVEQPDRSVRIPIRNGRLVPFSYRCRPVELERLASPISGALSRNAVYGSAHGFRWELGGDLTNSDPACGLRSAPMGSIF